MRTQNRVVIALVLIIIFRYVFLLKKRSHAITLVYDRESGEQILQPANLNINNQTKRAFFDVAGTKAVEINRSNVSFDVVKEAELENEGRTKTIETNRSKVEPNTTTASSRSPTITSNHSRVIIHVGPFKTGTSSIQSKSALFAAKLRKDGYEMAWFSADNATREKLVLDSNQVHFASCFLPKNNQGARNLGCVQELLDIGKDIAAHNETMFVTSEYFSSPKLDIESLATYLSRWPIVTIIVYYRRYYDWSRSLFNQQNKYCLNLYNDDDISRLSKRSIVNFLTNRNKDGRYTLQVLQRYAEHFDNVKVVNFHDKSKDLAESFYCDHMTGANNMCKAITEYKEEMRDNPSRPLSYMYLAYGAHMRGLINIKTKQQMKSIVYRIKQHQEQTLGLTAYDFKLNCPSTQDLQSTLNLSLKIEKELFPTFFLSPSGESDLRSDFGKQAKTTLCNVDVDITLMTEEWNTYFKSLKRLYT